MNDSKKKSCINCIHFPNGNRGPCLGCIGMKRYAPKVKCPKCRFEMVAHPRGNMECPACGYESPSPEGDL